MTYNPAILPDGMVDPDKEYSNVTNYYGEYDPLTMTEEAIEMGDRIPGDHYTIHNGLPLSSLLKSNHTGYVDKDENGNFTVEVGKEGQPGHGFIHVGAGDHIATSLWTGESLYGGNSSKIDINKQNMTLLADGLQSLAQGRMDNATTYLNHSIDIVKDESEKFDDRITTMQEVFERLIHEAAGDPLFKGITRTGDILIACVDGLIGLLNSAEEKCHFLNSILDSKPVELIEYVTSTDISVETLFEPPKSYLSDINDTIEEFVSNAGTLVRDKIPTLLKDSKDRFVDAVVGELDAHYDIIQSNQQKVLSQLSNYEQQIRGVAEAFDQMDTSLASSIESKSDPSAKINQIPETKSVTLEDSPYLKEKMRIKEIQVEYAHGDLKILVHTLVMPAVMILKDLVHLLELALDAILTGIESAKNIALHGNPVSSIINLFTDFDQKVRDAVQDIKEPIEEMQSTVHGIRKGLGRLHANLPEVIEEFKPYLDTAIFQSGSYSNVRLYNIASTATFAEMGMQFDDIKNQLSGEKAEAIQSAVEVSTDIRHNLHLLNSQVERGTVG